MEKFRLIINHNNKKPYHLQYLKNGRVIWFTPGYFNRKDCTDVIEYSHMNELGIEFENIEIEKR